MKPPPEVNAKGNIEAVTVGSIKMMTNANQPILVMVSSPTKIRVTGTANPDYIRKGVYVEFTAEVSKQKTVKEKVRRLKVFSPTQEKGIGLSSQGSGGQKATGTTPNAGGNAIQLPAVCVVRGQVKGCRAGNLTINVGHGSVKAELADDAKISVDVADLTAASKGDAISVKGRGRSDLVEAETVTIKASNPLSGGKKKVSRADQVTPKPPTHPEETPIRQPTSGYDSSTRQT